MTFDMNDAELRLQGGEGIVGDLGLGARNRRQHGRLSRIGKAHEAGIGNQFEAQPDPALLARPALPRLARRLVRDPPSLTRSPTPSMRGRSPILSRDEPFDGTSNGNVVEEEV